MQWERGWRALKEKAAFWELVLPFVSKYVSCSSGSELSNVILVFVKHK